MTKIAHSQEVRASNLTDPRWWRFVAQRRVCDPERRNSAADQIALREPCANYSTATSLADDGFLILAPVAKTMAADMRAYFEAHPCSDPYRGEITAKTHVANFSDEIVARAPHALDIANDPTTIAAVAHVLGCKPTIAQMGAWWSFAADTPAEHAELWHRDVDDYRFLKLFLYLTDVDEDAGPHWFMRGSHRVDVLTEAGPRLADSLVMDIFGPQNLVTFTGMAGMRFLENTYGVHRGFPVKRGRRLIFQVLYGQRPMIYSPARPMGVGGNHDPYVNRLFH